MKWTKPSGATVETNDNPATVKAATDLGWKKKRGPKRESRNSSKADTK